MKKIFLREEFISDFFYLTILFIGNYVLSKSQQNKWQNVSKIDDLLMLTLWILIATSILNDKLPNIDWAEPFSSA